MPVKNGSEPATRADLKTLKDGLDNRIDGLDNRIDGLDNRIDGLDNRIDGLEKRMDDGFKRLAVEIVKTNGRMGKIERSLREDMASNTNRILSALDASAKRMEADHRAVILHGHALSENGQTLRNHEKRLTALESKA